MKRTTKRFIITLLTMLVLCTILPVSALAASTSISAKKATVIVGAQKTIFLKNNTQSVTWTISKKSVASINANGNKVEITGNKAGSTTVTAKVGKKKYSCKVTVKNAPKISKTKLTLNIGSTYDLTVTGTASSPKWSTSNKKVVSIKKVSARKYRLTGVKAGSATIKAEVNGKTLSCKVTVPSKPKYYGDTSNYNKNYKGNFDPRDVKNITIPGISNDARQVGDVAYCMTFSSPEFPVKLYSGSWPCCGVIELQATDPSYKDRSVEKKVYLDPKDISWVIEDPSLVNVKFYDCKELYDWEAINKARGYGSCSIVVSRKEGVGSTRVHFYYKGLHWITYVNVTKSEPEGSYRRKCSICGNIN